MTESWRINKSLSVIKGNEEEGGLGKEKNTDKHIKVWNNLYIVHMQDTKSNLVWVEIKVPGKQMKAVKELTKS